MDAGLRVLIELFDRDPVENVLAACIFQPEIVVYLCDERDSAFFKESAIYRLFKHRGIKTLPRFYYFDACDPVGIRGVLEAVVRDYPGCVFDFSGGRDLVLLVAGACFAELRLPGFYIDLGRERFINLRGCGALADRFAIPSFTAEDVFAMTGATVHGYGHFHTTGIDGDFERDILAVFDVVAKNPRAWGEFVSYLQGLCAGTPQTALSVEGPRRLKTGRANPVLIGHLQNTGVITHSSMTRHRLELTFKSPLHRRCLLIEGVWLELFCYVTARQSGVFTDARTSVVVDWDGVEGGSDNAKNEVDVFLVRGVTPVFVSCKMSLPSALALSEIRLLATKFGGSQSRAVVLTAGQLGDNHRALRARAQDLGIHILDKTVLDAGTLAQKLTEIAGTQAENQPRLVDSHMLPASQ